jgi:hypothetical protein
MSKFSFPQRKRSPIRFDSPITPSSSKLSAINLDDDDDFMPKSLANSFLQSDAKPTIDGSRYGAVRVELDGGDTCVRIVGVNSSDIEEILDHFSQFGEILAHKGFGNAVHLQYQTNRSAKSAIFSCQRNRTYLGKEKKLVSAHLIPGMDYRDPNRPGMDLALVENTPRKARRKLALSEGKSENQIASYGSGFCGLMNWGQDLMMKQGLDSDHFFCRVFGNSLVDPENSDEEELEASENSFALDELRQKVHSMLNKPQTRI